MKPLKIAHMYPELMNLYGDCGNIAALVQRCRWREIPVEVTPVGVGDSLADDYDILFIGGGQDREQLLVRDDLMSHRQELVEMVAGGLVVLAVCGGYQLLGHEFLTHQGDLIDGLGLLDVTTVGGRKRLIGNVVARADWLPGRPVLIGFENHSGRTKVGPKAQPLAKVESGFGNNGSDATEGARNGHVFGTYLHGSLLPKNPWFADYLLEAALKRRRGDDFRLEPLDDALEKAARASVERRIHSLHRRRWLPELLKR